ncbi:MAG: CDP-alcohol phosphatidyltransferase family protein [Verrucomicrobia bacterium]|nr:CDP-alcohol phosphatidyltransferase family protein [Verrucomicrobiota bacterium]
MGGTLAQLRLVTALTIARFPLVLLFFVGAILHTFYPSTIVFSASLTALVVSALTDLFDGKLARKYNVVTDFGAHADPLMDKFFYLATLPLLVFVAQRNDHTTHAIVLLVITVTFLTRDQWVTFLRAIGSMYNVSGGAQWAGKLRTAINFPLVIFIYLYEEWPALNIPLASVYAFEGLAMLINFVSLYTYTHHYWPYIRKATRIKGVRTTDE